MSKELKLEIEKLKNQLELLNKRVRNAKYGLVWLDIPESFEDSIENQMPVLTEIKDKEILSKDGKPTNILIEGDNYHALTCLNYTHKKKIDLIYIDPPYNTGSDGFRYKDKRILDKFPDGSPVPKDHPLRHSYWLSFMSKRIELAFHLLKDDGVMFLSINEDEYSQLKLLCDKIFQESNYLTTFTIKVRHEDRILKGDKDFHETTEYLLMFRKSSAYKTIKRMQDNTSIDEYIYEVVELEENPEIIKMGSKDVKVFKPGEYEIVKGEASLDKLKKINIRGTLKEGNSSGRFYMAHMDEIKDNFSYLYKVPDMGSDQYDYRYFLAPSSTNKLNGDYFQGVPKDRNDIKYVPYPNFFDFENIFNSVGYEGGVSFRNGKKPVEFLKHILNIGTSNKNAIVLDFFAGSGSTGHAVLEQNLIDGGKRQFILVTNNENNIATEVTQPRIKNAITGYNQQKNQKEILFEAKLNLSTIVDNHSILDAVERFKSDEYNKRYNEIKHEIKDEKFRIAGIIKKEVNVPGLGSSLKYYRTDFVGKNNAFYAHDEDKTTLALKAGYLLAIAENTLHEICQTNCYQLFEKSTRATAIYYTEDLSKMEEFISKVEEFKKQVAIYLFSWGNESEFESLFDHLPNVSIKTIPQPILEIYKNIYNLVEA